jgi:hypothetical protein
MKILFMLLFIYMGLSSKEITPNEVYAQSIIIEEQTEALLKYFNIDYKSVSFDKRKRTKIEVRPRNVWQKTYEILIKINILRNKFNLPSIAPSNLTPVLNMNSSLVYEQTQRVLTELEIFKFLLEIPQQKIEIKTYENKTSLDVFDELSYISEMFDILNEENILPSLIFGTSMRIYDDINLILSKLEIEDDTIPSERKVDVSAQDNYLINIQILQKIKQLQILSGIPIVDFSNFDQKQISTSDVFMISQMVLSELQTLKAYMGITVVSPVSGIYYTKTSNEVNQILTWNLRKLDLIKNLERGMNK